MKQELKHQLEAQKHLRKWATEVWTTVQIAPLPPGWTNVYEWKGEQTTEPCPALLLQELRALTHHEEYRTGGGALDVRERTQMKQAPYETREVFASLVETYITPTEDISNYSHTEWKPENNSEDDKYEQPNGSGVGIGH